jgi:hypothetical protein
MYSSETLKNINVPRNRHLNIYRHDKIYLNDQNYY